MDRRGAGDRRLTAVQLSAGADGPTVAATRAAALSRGLRPLVIAAADTPDAADADLVLLDARAPGVYGGGGATLDWRALAADERLPTAGLVLAGGLTVGNVAEAIALVRPLAVDTSSGVELAGAPGHKDDGLLRAFLCAVRHTKNAGATVARTGDGARATVARTGDAARATVARAGEGADVAGSPDRGGHPMSVTTRFGPYGSHFVPESLIPALDELTCAYEEARADDAFRAELARLLADYAGRPTPLYHAARLSERCGATVYLKREDLCHTGAHKINNVLGQTLLAARMGKRRVIAETGAGQHRGAATATACALLGLECEVSHWVSKTSAARS